MSMSVLMSLSMVMLMFMYMFMFTFFALTTGGIENVWNPVLQKEISSECQFQANNAIIFQYYNTEDFGLAFKMVTEYILKNNSSRTSLEKTYRMTYCSTSVKPPRTFPLSLMCLTWSIREPKFGGFLLLYSPIPFSTSAAKYNKLWSKNSCTRFTVQSS
jgi:hypothetical protein